MVTLIEDSRQQAGKHAVKHAYWQAHDVTLVRSKLVVGDYTTWGNRVSVDTKANVEEIAANIGGKEHARFREECKIAQQIGAKLIVLVENENGIECVDDVVKWVNPNFRKTARSIDGNRLCKAMKTMSERYGVQFEFCRPDEAGRRVLELLGVEDDGRMD